MIDLTGAVVRLLTVPLTTSVDEGVRAAGEPPA